MALKRLKSNVAFLEAKMLFFYFFFLNCCFSVSMGSAIEEFQENFKALVELANKELFLHVPVGKFQCSCVGSHLNRTMAQLNTNSYLENDQMRRHISLMGRNVHHIIATFHRERTEPVRNQPCKTKEKLLQNALDHYKKFFQRLHESCQVPTLQ